jgi:hypothetical protein
LFAITIGLVIKDEKNKKKESERIMKKIIALITLIMCCFSLFACQGPQGEKGDKGDPGVDGQTPYIGANGNWWVGDTDLGVAAQGPQGSTGPEGPQGPQGEKGDNGDFDFNGEVTVYDGSEGLDFYPLPHGCYGVMVGKASYLYEIIIPAEYNGKIVDEVLDSGFRDCEYVYTLVIPESIEFIGNDAFLSCDRLETIIFAEGSNLMYICARAFSSCISLKNVNLPERLKIISFEAFEDCKILESIIIPASVSWIDEQAFAGCIALENITFEGTIEQWNEITKGDDWNNGVPATEVICSNGTVPLN